MAVTSGKGHYDNHDYYGSIVAVSSHYRLIVTSGPVAWRLQGSCRPRRSMHRKTLDSRLAGSSDTSTG